MAPTIVLLQSRSLLQLASMLLGEPVVHAFELLKLNHVLPLGFHVGILTVFLFDTWTPRAPG